MSLMSHLWQSTLCLLLAALLALVFRRASARIRHTIWTFASVKFLVPFSLFVLAGNYLGSLASPLTSPEVSIAIRWLDRPLSLWNLGAHPTFLGGQTLVLLALVWALGTAGLTAWRWKEWRALSRLVRVSTRLDEGREVRLLRGITRGSNASPADRDPSMPFHARAWRSWHCPAKAAVAGRTLRSTLRSRARIDPRPRGVPCRSTGQPEGARPSGRRTRVLVPSAGLVAWNPARRCTRARVR